MGKKIGNGLITCLRVDRFYLNANAYSIGLAQSSQCFCCTKQETTLNILSICPSYDSGRRCKAVCGLGASGHAGRRDKTTLFIST